MDYMQHALSLASLALGHASPNPAVGAVIVKDDKVVGEGYTQPPGSHHAEIVALQQAREKASRATMYVTLEPCCYQGRTPPCTQAIIAAGIAEVHMAMIDPNNRVSGRGQSELRAAGIRTILGEHEEEAQELNEAYVKFVSSGLPFVIGKYAMSLDGKIATKTGDSKWITNERSRAYAHKIRSKVDAILVGGATARADDPSLTARLGREVFYPPRVVVTASGNVPDSLKIVCEPGECIVAAPVTAGSESLRKLERAGARILTLSQVGGRPSVRDLMAQLGKLGYLSVLIEGGGEVAASALEERVVDKILYFYAPKIIGGREAINSVGGLGADTVASAIKLDRIRVRRFGDNVAIEGYVVYPEG